MTEQQVVSLITQAALILIGILTIIDWARHPHETRRDVAILFGELGLVAVAQILAAAPWSGAGLFGLAAGLLLMAHPYLLLRLVPHFQPVPRVVEIIAVVGLLASLAALVLVPAPQPPWLVLVLVAYFAYVEGYATWSFVRGARSTAGVTHWRLLLAATGSGYVAFVIFMAGLTAAFPALQLISILSQVAAILAVLNYYFAFATPSAVRRFWQLSELQRFLKQSAGNWVEGSEQDMLARLCAAAMRSVGGLEAIVALLDANGELRVRGATGTASVPLDWVLSGPVSRRVQREQAPQLALAADLTPEKAEIAQRVGAEAVLMAPLATPERAIGILLVYTRRVPLFTADDLELLTLLCEQTAIALGYSQSLTELRDSEQELRALFSAMTDVILVLDRRGQFLRVAPTTPTFSTPRDWENKSIDQVFPPEQARILLSYVQLALDTQQPVKLEYQSETNDRSSWFSASMSPTGGDRVLWVARDITERKQAEEALRHYTERLEGIREIDRAILAVQSPQEIAHSALARLRHLVPSYRAGVVLFDWEHEQARLFAVETSLGDSPGTDVSVPLSEFESPGDLIERKTIAYYDDLTRLADPPSFLASLIEQGARSALFAPLVVEGKLIGQLNVFSLEANAFTPEHQEIAREVAGQVAVTLQQALLRQQLVRYTEELEQRVDERTAELQEANKELEAFSYSVSHDLRAPLRALTTFAELLQQDYAEKLDDEGIHYLELVRENAAEMSSLIESLLAFSRTSRQDLNKELVAPAELVSQVIEALAPETQGRNIEWVIGSLPQCQADPRLLKQVWMNLLSNAVKFTRTREVARIEIGYCAMEGQGTYFVRDNGVGFDMAYVDKLFGVFQRLHHADEYPGTGVGLALVQRIIRRHGGRIWAEAKPDEGAAFYFTLGSRGTR